MKGCRQVNGKMTDASTQEKKIIAMMCTREEVVKKDIEYMEMYYPRVDQICNKGQLTLISKYAMEWDKVLVTAINLNTTKNKYVRRRIV